MSDTPLQPEADPRDYDARRCRRIAAAETIGCALAVLRRLDYVWYDDEIRDMVTKARSTLSVAKSKVRQRIDPTIQEGTP